MSYTKTDWQARLGVDLNRFATDKPTIPFIQLTNSPTSVSQVGTPFNISNMNNIEKGVKDAADPVEVSSGTSTDIEIETAGDNSIINIEIEELITGAAITLNRNSAGSKPLELYDGTPVEELEAGIIKVIEKPTVFIYAPSGGSSSWIKSIQHGEVALFVNNDTYTLGEELEDYTNAFAIFHTRGYTVSTGFAFEETCVRFNIISNTTFQLVRSEDTRDVYIDYTVIEIDPDKVASFTASTTSPTVGTNAAASVSIPVTVASDKVLVFGHYTKATGVDLDHYDYAWGYYYDSVAEEVIWQTSYNGSGAVSLYTYVIQLK